jgi:uncharacterized protein (DUF2236 family)
MGGMPTLASLIATLRTAGVPLAGDLVRAGLGRAFGAPPFDPNADPGDPGLLGPEAASWRILAEPAAIVGGIRALLVQLLHPLAMAGVADHSSFRDDPLGRLHRTSAYVTATAFGSSREALRVVRRVRAAHAPVAGTAPDGRPYRASDPRLLTWVSVALTSSFLATDRAYAPRPADRATADAFVAEQSSAAALLDPGVDLDALAADEAALAALRVGRLPLPLLEAGMLPRDVDDLSARLATFRPEFAVYEQGRTALRFLLWPDLDPPLKAGYLPLLGAAVATLAPEERRLLGLPRLPVAPVRVPSRALMAAFRLATGPSPALAAARRRTAGGPPADPGDSHDHE